MSLPPPPVPPVGGYVGPYATSVVPLGPMRPLRGLWISLLVLFALVGVADIVAAGAFFNRAGLLDDVADGNFPDTAALLDADDAVQRGLVAHGLLLLVLAVVFIIWQFRHAKNAQALGEQGGLGPGWAIGGWFIPLASLVIPGVQIHQSSRLSDPAIAGQPGGKGKGAGIVIVWMVLLALASAVFVIGGGMRETDADGNVEIDSIDDVSSAASDDRAAAVGMVLFVGAAVAGAVMVQSLSTNQALAFQARLRSGRAGAPPPPASGAPIYGAPPAPTPPAPPGQWGGPPPPWSHPPPPVTPPPAPPEPPTPWGTPPP